MALHTHRKGNGTISGVVGSIHKENGTNSFVRFPLSKKLLFNLRTKQFRSSLSYFVRFIFSLSCFLPNRYRLSLFVLSSCLAFKTKPLAAFASFLTWKLFDFVASVLFPRVTFQFGTIFDSLFMLRTRIAFNPLQKSNRSTAACTLDFTKLTIPSLSSMVPVRPAFFEENSNNYEARRTGGITPPTRDWTPGSIFVSRIRISILGLGYQK